ncbi:MAG: hypothetical protein K2Y27_26755 [Xanthobacteraceae bacterium]|nr:hypothetical protein [Xanthobacteraceae bacterium]
MLRIPTVAALGALLLAAAPASAQPAAPKSEPPYHGLWGSTAKACRDPDGVSRLEINPNGFYWYETRCKVSGITPDGLHAWRMRLACEGEGETFQKRTRLTLPAPSRLVLHDGPVGRSKRDAYVRCRFSR